MKKILFITLVLLSFCLFLSCSSSPAAGNTVTFLFHESFTDTNPVSHTQLIPKKFAKWGDALTANDPPTGFAKEAGFYSFTIDGTAYIAQYQSEGDVWMIFIPEDISGESGTTWAMCSDISGTTPVSLKSDDAIADGMTVYCCVATN